LAALGAGLVVLLAVAPTWSQLRSIALVLAVATVPAIVAGLMPGVVNFDATESAREVQGFVLIGVLALAMLAGGAVAAWGCRAERTGAVRVARLPLPRRAGLIAAALVVLAAGAFVASAAKERRESTAPTGATAQRFGSLQSNRYQYWRVAVRVFADHPLRGTGTAGFRVEWLRRRTIGEQAKDAHSLYLETAAELGLVGLALLATVLAGVALAARRALRLAPETAAGPVAVVVLWAFHAGIDWDWEMPTVTLIGLAFAAALLALAEGAPGSEPRRVSDVSAETPPGAALTDATPAPRSD
jgi:O-antigen ligase